MRSHSKDLHFSLILPRIDKTVSCVLINACSKSKDKLFLLAAIALNSEFMET